MNYLGPHSLLQSCSWAVWRGRSSPSERRTLWKHSAPPDSPEPSSCTAWHERGKTARVFENTAPCTHGSKVACVTIRAALTWSCRWGLKHRVSATLESKSWLPDCEWEDSWKSEPVQTEWVDSQTLTRSYLMSFLRRSQPYTPPSPLYRVPDTTS